MWWNPLGYLIKEDNLAFACTYRVGGVAFNRLYVFPRAYFREQP